MGDFTHVERALVFPGTRDLNAMSRKNNWAQFVNFFSCGKR
jgi:hypothetical protein